MEYTNVFSDAMGLSTPNNPTFQTNINKITILGKTMDLFRIYIDKKRSVSVYYGKYWTPEEKVKLDILIDSSLKNEEKEYDEIICRRDGVVVYEKYYGWEKIADGTTMRRYLYNILKENIKTDENILTASRKDSTNFIGCITGYPYYFDLQFRIALGVNDMLSGFSTINKWGKKLYAINMEILDGMFCGFYGLDKVNSFSTYLYTQASEHLGEITFPHEKLPDNLRIDYLNKDVKTKGKKVTDNKIIDAEVVKYIKIGDLFRELDDSDLYPNGIKIVVTDANAMTDIYGNPLGIISLDIVDGLGYIKFNKNYLDRDPRHADHIIGCLDSIYCIEVQSVIPVEGTNLFLPGGL